jgi:glycosyltransferase involved in cell wall biosynthesis
MTGTRQVEVALLTGGGDKPYAFGLATALMAQGIALDLVAGDELTSPVFDHSPAVTFMNLRGSQASDVSLLNKVARVLVYYLYLLKYALIAKPAIFHILWNNKFEIIDRTLLLLYYKALGKKIVLTVHNVNAGVRDKTDSALNRFTLRVQYWLADHLFVHTNKMKAELVADWSVAESAITVVPFGINNAVPHTAITPSEAKQQLGIGPGERAVLFYGSIAPYKGVEYLVAAVKRLAADRDNYRLIIAGGPKKGSEQYWAGIRRKIDAIAGAQVSLRIEFIPDEETELYFKAADVVILPYTEIFQSGVLFLAYSFGLPAIVTDVGSLREDVVEGETGLVCRARDSADLAQAIDRYFSSALYEELPSRRREILDYAAKRHSWNTVAEMTSAAYRTLVEREFAPEAARRSPAL